MSMMQRSKGKAGEREIAAIIRDLTGWDVRRRVRQHDGDDDLVGAPGWAIEVKRQKAAGRGLIAAWWRQCEAQARGVAKPNAERSAGVLAVPVLFYRLDRADWRAVWPLAVTLMVQRADYWRDYAWTADTTVEAWAAVAREIKA